MKNLSIGWIYDGEQVASMGFMIWVNPFEIDLNFLVFRIQIGGDISCQKKPKKQKK